MKKILIALTAAAMTLPGVAHAQLIGRTCGIIYSTVCMDWSLFQVDNTTIRARIANPFVTTGVINAFAFWIPGSHESTSATEGPGTSTPISSPDITVWAETNDSQGPLTSQGDGWDLFNGTGKGVVSNGNGNKGISNSAAGCAQDCWVTATPGTYMEFMFTIPTFANLDFAGTKAGFRAQAVPVIGSFACGYTDEGAGTSIASNECDTKTGGGTPTFFSVSTVPEPSTYALMAAGLAALGFVARRKRNNA